MSRYHLNTPLNNEVKILTDKITVTDPTHPLFGRTFTIASRVHCGSNILVTYRNDIILSIPFSATNLVDREDFIVSKLTYESLYEFVSLAKEYKLLCHGVSRKGEYVQWEKAHQDKSRSPVTGVAVLRETKILKPTDNIIVRIMVNHQAVTRVNT